MDRDLEFLLQRLAANAPAKQNKYSTHALVSWRLVNELRERLDALGINWRIYL